MEWAFWILEQAACKVNGIKLNNVRSVLKIIDILKIPEEEKRKFIRLNFVIEVQMNAV